MDGNGATAQGGAGVRSKRVLPWVIGGIVVLGLAGLFIAVIAPAQSSGGGGAAPTSTITPTTIEVPPAATEAPDTLADIFPPTVAGFTPGEVVEDPGPVEEGAISAATTTYGNGAQELAYAASQWPSAEEASAFAQQLAAAAGFTPDQALTQGDVGSPPVGAYWYYERDGVAELYFSHGVTAVHVTGDPQWVQEFFVQFPQPRV